MRVLDLDQLAERLVTSSRTDDLTSEHVVLLRDAILFGAVLDILESLGGALSTLTARNLRERFGDGTGLRAPEAGAGLDRVGTGMDQYVTNLIRQGSAVHPSQFTLQVMYATRSVSGLVSKVAGADDDYAPSHRIPVGGIRAPGAPQGPRLLGRR